MSAGELWERVESNVDWIEPRAARLVEMETERTRALDAKASQVLAVSAVATSVAATAFVPELGEASLAANVAGAAAAVLVILAAAASVASLYPRSFSSFASSEIEQWPTGDFLTARSRDVQGRILNGWLGMIYRARKLNDSKARLVRIALVCLALALAATAASAGIIVSDV